MSVTSLGSPLALQWAHAWEPLSAPLKERAKALLSGPAWHRCRHLCRHL